MQTIRVHTTQNVFIHYPLASIGDRILAYIIDYLTLIFYVIVVVALFINIEVKNEWIWIMVLSIPFLFYGVLFEIFMNGQTPGKYAMKIKVVKLDGTPPTVGSYILRWIFAFVDFYIMSGVVAVITISAGGKGQRLGDIVAGTCVVKLVEQKEITADEIFVAPQQDTYTPTFTQVVMLTERDIELIQQALEVNRTQGNTQPVYAVCEKIKALLGIETDLPPVKFLYAIIKDFNHLTSR